MSSKHNNNQSKSENYFCETNPSDSPNNLESLKDFTEIQQLIAENIPDRVFAKDIKGRYIFMNRSNYEFWGIPLGKVLGKTDWDLHHQLTAETFTESDRIVLETGKPCCVEEHVKTRDGRDVVI